ncbi:beta-N-hexosaminidase [Aspergillus egyptiacus]|nr:beta-N-hexosaminidase [Aspergillus egyptiacus]
MAGNYRIAAALLYMPFLAAALQLLPPVPSFSESDTITRNRGWDAQASCNKIYIDQDFAFKKDADGLTLIPPSGHDFAKVVLEDLTDITGLPWVLETVVSLPDPANANGAILLGPVTGSNSSMTYENGQPTSEAYELEISPSAVSIRGTGTRGLWWGARTVLQMLLISGNNTLPPGQTSDSPSYASRGYMIDAGRKWYPPDFLKEMCSYASFFKMNEFHYHLSDNYPLNRGRNATWQDVYSHFSLLPDRDQDLRGLLHGRENETLSRADYADMQRHCAARGIAVIPEIEAPGHSLYLTKWKPELALEKRDLLNLSHAETIPTIQRIWAEFLPWFAVKEVHIGADEYDASLADEYISFVNEMAHFISRTANKSIRIWGTPMKEPNQAHLRLNPAITVQHWQYGQSDPLALLAQGHHVLNSQDWWAYMSIKNDHTPIYPATYPQFFNRSRILNFANEPGRQWTPADFNHVNSSAQPAPSDPLLSGAVMAAWNDNGPDASTKLEMYYAMRPGMALVAARAWSGSRGPPVNPESLPGSIDFFSPRAPGQNLDRVVIPDSENKETAPRIISWTRSENKRIGKGSKGPPYTLTLTTTGPFTLSNADTDTTLSLTPDGTLTFTEDNYIYPLRQVTPQDALNLDPGHPGRIWVNSSSTHEVVRINVAKSSAVGVNITISTDVLHGAVVWVDGELVGRFEVFVFGGGNRRFSWSQMAFVAPVEEVRGLQESQAWKPRG